MKNTIWMKSIVHMLWYCSTGKCLTENSRLSFLRWFLDFGWLFRFNLTFPLFSLWALRTPHITHLYRPCRCCIHCTLAIIQVFQTYNFQTGVIYKLLSVFNINLDSSPHYSLCEGNIFFCRVIRHEIHAGKNYSVISEVDRDVESSCDSRGKCSSSLFLSPFSP